MIENLTVDKPWLMMGDCLERSKEIPDQFVDAAIFDLPYGTTQCKWDCPIDLDLMWLQVERILKPNGIVILTGCQPFTSKLVFSNLDMFRYSLVWEKTTATGHLNAKKMPMRAHEDILVFYKNPGTYNPIKTTGHKRKTAKNVDRGMAKSGVYGSENGITSYDSTERYPRSVINISTDKQKSKLHPTQKPVALMEYLLKTYTNEGDVTADFTGGVFTLGVAAKNLKRLFIGIEMDETYFNIGKDRISKA